MSSMLELIDLTELEVLIVKRGIGIDGRSRELKLTISSQGQVSIYISGKERAQGSLLFFPLGSYL